MIIKYPENIEEYKYTKIASYICSLIINAPFVYLLVHTIEHIEFGIKGMNGSSKEVLGKWIMATAETKEAHFPKDFVTALESFTLLFKQPLI